MKERARFYVIELGAGQRPNGLVAQRREIQLLCRKHVPDTRLGALHINAARRCELHMLDATAQGDFLCLATLSPPKAGRLLQLATVSSLSHLWHPEKVIGRYYSK
jgi:hypothetical protein